MSETPEYKFKKGDRVLVKAFHDHNIFKGRWVVGTIEGLEGNHAAQMEYLGDRVSAERLFNYFVRIPGQDHCATFGYKNVHPFRFTKHFFLPGALIP